MMQESRKKNDLRLILILLLIAVLALGARSLLFQGSGKSVIVSQDGNITAEYPLDRDRVEVISAPSGGSNTLHISGGEVWVTDATCPDKICERTGRISLEGEVIVCMPNRLTIRIEA